jgi:hypothetical protein
MFFLSAGSRKFVFPDKIKLLKISAKTFMIQ